LKRNSQETEETHTNIVVAEELTKVDSKTSKMPIRFKKGNPINVDTASPTLIVALASFYGKEDKGLTKLVQDKWSIVKKMRKRLISSIAKEFVMGMSQSIPVQTNTQVSFLYCLDYSAKRDQMVIKPDLIFKSLCNLKYKAEKDGIETIVFPLELKSEFLVEMINKVFRNFEGNMIIKTK
jgi:hypothetical protein